MTSSEESGNRPQSTDAIDHTTGSFPIPKTKRETDPVVPTIEDHLNRMTDGFFALDTEWRFTYLNDHADTLINPEGRDLIGKVVWEEFPDALVRDFEPKYRHAMEHQDPVSFEEYYPEPLDTWFSVNAYPSETGLSVYFRDVTEEKNQEHDLQRYQTITETASDGIITIDTESIVHDANPAVEEILGYTPKELIGESLGMIMSDDAQESHRSAVAHFLQTGERTMSWEGVELRAVHADGHCVPIKVSFAQYTHGDRRYFTGILRDISEEKKQEEQLAHQHERAETINECYEIVRDIGHTIIDSTERECVEHEACNRLIDNDLDISMAWIGDVRYKENEIVPTYSAGDAEGYLEDVTIPIDQENLDMTGPGLRAVKTHTPQPVSDIRTDESIAPWRETMLERGYHSAIAVPLVHNNLVYGLLALYSEEPYTFDGEVSEIFGHLGELIGHTIHSIEQDKALHEDNTVYEVEYINTSFGDLLGGLVADAGSGRDRETTIEIERTVKHNGSHRLFARTQNLSPNAFIDVFEQIPTVKSISLVRNSAEDGGNTTDPESEPQPNLDTSCEDCLYLAELTSDALAVQIEQFGGRAKHLTLTPTDLRLVVETPTTTDIKEFTARVQEVYPETELVSKRAVERETPTIEEIDKIIDSDLTARQHDVLESAYMAGYFELPRENTGEDIAEMLNISGATFSQHLRTAQNKLFSSIF